MSQTPHNPWFSGFQYPVPAERLSAAREVARRKPIIILKAGRTQEVIQAATSHAGALTVSYDVFNAACPMIKVVGAKSTW